MLAAESGTLVVTTTISHRPTSHVANLDDVLIHNLRLLRDAGVPLALGTDDQRTIVSEIENINRLGVFSDAVLVELAVGTSRAIFPERKIGKLASGFESSFIGLREDPTVDAMALASVDLRVIKGHVLEIEESDEKPGIGNTLVSEIMSKGVESAISTYHRLRREAADDYDFDEAQLNGLGYALIQHQQIEAAIAIFRLNTEIFPDASNTWDSLGEAYSLDGRREKAVESYERRLALNPHNENAVEKLRQLRIED